MSPYLYVYDNTTLNNLKNKLCDYQFYSIAYFFQQSDTLENIGEIDFGLFEKCVIDVTNLVKDGNYFKIFAERYIMELYNNIDNICFCIDYDVFDKIIRMFPHLFDEDNISFEFHDNTDEIRERANISEVITSKPLTISTYTKLSKVQEYYKTGKLIPLSDLIDECEEIYFRYNIDNILKTIELKNIEYIDLSSVFRMFKLRQDLIFPFEILIRRIIANKEVKYCIEQSLIVDVTTLFPFWILEKNPIDKEEDINSLVKNPEQINIKEVMLIAENICKNLRGHDAFKSDFRQQLLKFFLMNKMGERKILSIILCGDSGIGKTQFAKFMSQEMFPEEPLIKISFGNYSTEGVLNSLIGSPLGYVGSEEGGELINKIATSKSRVILIDEFEKATPSVYNFFYELLEDGVFTDRHGVEHNLDGYMIVFTSNMTQDEYLKHIPNSLKSRFDMVYYFVNLQMEEKMQYIELSALSLIEKLEKNFNRKVDIQNIRNELSQLTQYNNLRDIKRAVEDIVFNAFLPLYINEETF